MTTADFPTGRFITLESFGGMEWDVPTWMWEPEVDGQPHGAIPLGSMAMFAGRPGAGKSSAGRAFAAQVTRGTLPGCWKGTPHNVAYIAGEESLKYNVVPGLIAAGADMNRISRPQVNFVTPDGEAEVVGLVPEKDMRELTCQLKEQGVKLVIVDPLMEYMGTDADVYKNNEVRAKIKPWSKLAEDIDGVVIAVMHLNKSGSGDVVAGINGSSAFGEVARAVFGFAKDPDSEDGDRIMSQEKNSIGTEGAAWVYRIVSRQIINAEGKAGDFGAFEIIGTSDRTVGELLRDATLPGTEDAGDIKAVVLDYLAANGGEARVADIQKEVREAGYNFKTAQNQKKKWGIDSAKVKAGWVWKLKTPTPSEHPTLPRSRDVGMLGSSKVTGMNQGPNTPRSQDPTAPRARGSSPIAADLDALVLDLLSETHPQGLGTIMRLVKEAGHPGAEVPAALTRLKAAGLVTEHDGQFTRKAAA